MKKIEFLTLVIGLVLCIANNLNAQIGYYDAPYVRYEADLGTLVNATSTPKSYNQSVLQSEASDQICVNMSNAGASVNWTVTADGDGLVVRYSVPDGQSGVLEVYANNVLVGTLNLTSYYSWEYLSSNGNPNNVGVINTNPKMRFDEVRMKLPSKILAGGNLKLTRQSGTIYLDFAELEAVPASIPSSGGNVVYGGNGSDLQTVIDNNGGATIYLPPGVYNVNRDLYFGVANTVLKGAGMWYTQINFTSGAQDDGGLWANANNISYSGLYLTTVRNSRSSSYKAINGVYTSGSTITNVWAEHFECGAWIAQYNTGPAVADGFTMSNCRFRNNYADGTNLCKGTKNAIVEHCSYRNNGDDDMAIWSANNQECQNNTFRYNTSENCWRASGCAIYGGLNNQAHHLLIKDNLEVGLRVGNNFGGAPFNGGGMHQFYNIRIIACGTYNDLFNSPVGAIDLLCTNIAGTRINNVKFSCIEILDSKNDAIYIDKKSGEGFYNLVFENITVDGTGREYPNNNAGTGNGGIRGYGLLFWGNPSGFGTYCNMTYANRGGNAGSDVNTSQIGSFSWSVAGSCPTGCSLGGTVTITTPTAGATIGGCPVGPINIVASSSLPSGNTVGYIEFFIDGVSIGTDNTSPYSINWNTPTNGSHLITAVAHYTPSNTTSTSSAVNINVGGINLTSTAPAIDGSVDPIWSSYATYSMDQSSGVFAPDLDATYKIMYDATNLYILVDVTDDVLVRDGSGGTWEDDGVEIFIDMGNDKAGAYGANDFQYSFNWNSATIIENKHSATAGVTFGQTNRAGGYVMEMKFPWSTLGGFTGAGTFMGFDIGVNDDDNNGTRDSQLSWNDASFGEWNNTALFGALQFSSCGPLPVSLLYFNGIRNKETVFLNWETSLETNHDKFIIERSGNSFDWLTIGEVKRESNTDGFHSYRFTDVAPLSGISYYRLKQIDLDGKSSFSNVVALQQENESAGVTIIPNPFEDTFIIQITAQGDCSISIHDVLGRLVYFDHRINNEGMILLNPSVGTGTYIVTIQTATSLEQMRIIKK